MPLQATSGAASYDAFGGGVPVVPNYIEDVFSCFLYSGTNAAQTITNNIDLSTYGGVVWQKARISAIKHRLFSTNMTLGRSLSSNSIFAEDTAVNITSYSTTGFTVAAPISDTGENYVTWTFRKQPKFFDVQTWTGSGVNRTIAHNLGSVPGCIIVKCIDDDFAWAVYHRSLANTQYLVLNSTAAAATGATWWNSTTPTSAVFSLGTDSTVNALNKSYIAYIYAHDAGGFGLTGTDNVISCGSFTTSGTSDPNATVNLGYEPQWLMFKKTNVSTGITANWTVVDNMRGWPAGQNNGSGTSQVLQANTSSSEFPFAVAHPTATGFTMDTGNTAETYIYIAIRRGPMKVPTSGTSVFSPVVRTGTSAAATVSTTNLTDMSLIINKDRSSNSYNIVSDRLRGPANTTSGSYNLTTNDAVAEYLPASATVTGFNNNNVTLGTNDGVNYSGSTYINYFFSRAPSFFDEVCYTGTGSANTAFTHNLTVTPELMIVKPRSAATAPNWRVWSPINSTDFNLLQLSTNGAASSSLYSSSNVFPAIPTATTFTVGGSGSIQLNESGQTFVAYLFATCAGVSKCGTFTGNGSSQTINCGFTGGARFVMIKATSTTGDWMVADSARGIVSGSDPYLELNNTNAEVTGEDWLDTDSTGFVVNEVSGSNANTNGVTYIFLAIA